MTSRSTKSNKTTSLPEEFIIPVDKIDRSLSLVMHHEEVSAISEVLKALMAPSDADNEHGDENAT